MNATLDVRSYETGRNKKWKIRRTTKVGGIAKTVQVEVVWACDEKRGAYM